MSKEFGDLIVDKAFFCRYDFEAESVIDAYSFAIAPKP